MTGHFVNGATGVVAPPACRQRGLVVFWGTAAGFSDWILRIAEAEAPAMDVIRVDQLADLPPGMGGKRFIFVSDDMAPDLLEHAGALFAAQPCARWVLAYRDETVALQLLAQRRKCGTLAGVGLLPMNLPIDQWTPMFQLCLGGDCMIPARLLDLDQASPDTAAPPGDPDAPPLTPREREVLAKVAEGKRNKTIAHELDLTEHTIKLHLHHLMKKIGVRNRTQAAQWYLTRHPASPP